MTSFEYAYLVATVPLLLVWTAFFLLRKDVRKEMLVMSFGIGVLSVVTAHYWWTVDWWHPPTITGTRVGVEDFLAGFGSGGIMAVAYEVLFRKRHYRMRRLCFHCPGPLTLLLLLAFLMSWLVWGSGVTSFWGSTIAMSSVAALLFYFRRDLFINGILSGLLMAIIALPSYFLIMTVAPSWIGSVYDFNFLSGKLLLGIPVEEFVFWFLAGMVFGPFYEYWQGERLRNADS